MNSKLYEVLQINKNSLMTEIAHLENFDSTAIFNLFDAVYHSLSVMVITQYITLEEADFALKQSANCLSYLVKEKFGKDVEFIEM